MGQMKSRHDRIRAFNKQTLNPLMLRFAGRNRLPFAVVYHVGRRSGKKFETPIIVERVRNGFVIALTYGPNVDWYRNLIAAKGGKLRWHNIIYDIETPEPIEMSEGLSHFPLPARAILRLTHTNEFLMAKQRRIAAGP